MVKSHLHGIDLERSLTSKTVMVVGDLMLDAYTFGVVKRISPEAPVPILHVEKEEVRAGGVGNAILNLVSLGMKVISIGRVGEDREGRQLLELLQSEQVDVRGIVTDSAFRTPLKCRMIADTQQLLRVDYEEILLLSSQLEKVVFERFLELLDGVSIIALSDYGKGFLTVSLLRRLIQEARKRKIPVLVDPKGIDFTRYNGATLLKPNLSEAYAAARLAAEDPLDIVGERLLEQIGIEYLLVTRSKEGISLFEKGQSRVDFPSLVREVKDVTGAGDTVLAVIASAMANEIALSHACELANVAAGLAVERLGCARISLEELTLRLLEISS